MATTFADLGLGDEVLRAVTDAGYSTPTPIQEKAIPAKTKKRIGSIMTRELVYRLLSPLNPTKTLLFINMKRRRGKNKPAEKGFK